MKLTPKGYIPRLIDKEFVEWRDTMSLYKSGDSSGEVSLKDLFENKVENKDIDDNITEEDVTLSRNTVTDYLNVLNRLHLIENQNSFMYRIRSRLNVGKNPKRHFVDPP